MVADHQVTILTSSMDDETIELETLKQSIHKSAEKRESAKIGNEE